MKAFKVCLLASVMSFTPNANAQKAGTGAGSGDIIVTARRQDELLQQTPVAVTAITEQSLQNNTIVSTDDLQRLAPNLSIRQAGGSRGQSFIFIRGIGLANDDPALEPGVAIYVDDVYVARTQGGIFDLNDAAQIEVLRGPQGTLYGKNSMGGAIKVTSKIPDQYEDYSARAAYGNYNDARLSMSINHPLVDDKLFLRVSGAIHRRDGTTENLGVGGPVNDVDTASGRLMLRYTPSDGLDLMWSVDGYRDRSHMSNNRLVAYDPTAQFGQAIIDAYGPLTPYLVQAGQDPHKGTGYNVALDQNIGFEPYQDQFGTSFRATWNGDAITLRSISAYRSLNSVRILDLDATPFSVLHIGDYTKQNQFSQEVQAIGDIGDGVLEYFGGLFYFSERITHDYRNSIAFINVSNDRRNRISTDSYAAYLNLTWNPTEQLSATVGGRYTSEKRGLTAFLSSRITGDVVFGPASKSKTFDNFSPKIEIDYKWTPNIFTYVSFSKGFRSGGFNSAPQSASEFTPFDPETASSYEVGLKSSFFDDKFIFNIAGFYLDYKDLQASAVVTAPSGNELIRVISNAANARIQGVEIETTIRPVPNLVFMGTFGLTDAKYKDFIDEGGNDFTSNALPLISKYNYTISGEYSAPLGDEGTFLAHLDWSWRSRMEVDVQNTPQASQASYGILNGRLSYRPKESVEIALYGKNLLDKRARAAGGGSPQPFGIYWGYYIDPRTYGLELNFDF